MRVPTRADHGVSMLGVTQWGRHLRFWLGLPARRRFTAAQVKDVLRGLDPGAGGAEIQGMVQRLPALIGEPEIRRRFDGFQRYLEVLPRIIFLYHRGVSPDDIAASLPFMATGVGVETVINIASEIVADRLNRAS
jgi:hypothetical protein